MPMMVMMMMMMESPSNYICHESVPQAFAQHADLVKSSDADIEQQAKFSTHFYPWHSTWCACAFQLPHAPLKCRFLYGVGADLEAL